MGYFVKKHIKLRKEGEDWYTDEKLEYITDNDVRIIVPEDFKTDGATLPRFFWRVVGHPFAEYLRAAVLHDRLYATKRFSRKVADKIFLEAMKSDNVNIIKRKIIYWAVRLFGGSHY